jgi:hypothetical protein
MVLPPAAGIDSTELGLPRQTSTEDYAKEND